MKQLFDNGRQYRQLVLTFDEPMRGAVAAILWWDHFSLRLVSERWDHLDGLIGDASKVKNCDLYDALLECGYPEWLAKLKITENVRSRAVYDAKRRAKSRLLGLQRRGR